MEFEILYFLQGLHQPLLDRLMVGITSLGNGGWFWIALTVLFLRTVGNSSSIFPSSEETLLTNLG